MQAALSSTACGFKLTSKKAHTILALGHENVQAVGEFHLNHEFLSFMLQNIFSQSPCEMLGGLSGFLSRRSRSLRPCVESVPEPEDSSPVLTWILGYFWSLPRGVSPRLEWGHAGALSSRAVTAVSRLPWRGSRDLGLSLEAFPRGFPTRLSHRAVPRATLVCVDPRALEKEMAAHSSVLAWRIPGTGEPGGLPSTGWHRVRHD